MSDDALTDYNDRMDWLDKQYAEEYKEVRRKQEELEGKATVALSNMFHMHKEDARQIVYEWEDYSDFN